MEPRHRAAPTVSTATDPAAATGEAPAAEVRRTRLPLRLVTACVLLTGLAFVQSPGFVVSDYTSDYELILHGVAADERQAAKIALSAGVDMSMQSGVYASQLPKLVASGELPMAVAPLLARASLFGAGAGEFRVE